MPNTTFVNGTSIEAPWMNDVNDTVYDILGNGTMVPATKAQARDNLGLEIGVDIPSNSGTGATGTWPINVTGSSNTASNVTGTVAIANGGTGATTASAARTALGTDNAANITSGDIAAARITAALNASGSAPLFACRAWVNFNGTGTLAIRASGNVTSVTDNGVGDYTINFTTAMQDTSFCMVGNMAYSGTYAVPGTAGQAVSIGAKTTSSQRIYTGNVVAAANAVWNPTDSVEVSVAIFR